ncbi:MAG TPA: redoxin domain-containing protein [Pyrinomonadaceae bacterium]|nr:redoxin domain-containing protein [Pyrinomonadaceae bacterium]
MEAILLLIRIILSAVFITAGIGKLLDLEGSEKAVKDFGVPENLAKPFAVLLPIAEILLGVLLLFTSVSWFGAVGSFLLLAVFIGGMLWQMKQGNAPDCHCFGAIHSEPVSAKSLIRNIVFAILALFLVISRENQGASFADLRGEMAIQLILGLAVVGFLGAIIFYLKKISEQQTQIMRRIELLEIISHEGGETKREDVQFPTEGLPIGAPVPDFAGENLKGRTTEFEHLLMLGKPLLFFFVGPNCASCTALLPEIEAWEKELKGKVNFVFVSNGNAKENSAKFGENREILLQKAQEIGKFFGALWTPTAVLVNADGTIASRLATGDAAIRELVAKVKNAENIDGMIYAANGDIANSELLGAEVPAFSASDVSGKNVSSEDLKGKRTLLTFWSLTCGWCGQMLGDLREWDKTRGLAEPNLLLVSSGDAERNRELGFRGTVLIDDEKALPQSLKMDATPSAVLIDEDGKIVSEIAVGAQNIWALLGKNKQ